MPDSTDQKLLKLKCWVCVCVYVHNIHMYVVCSTYTKPLPIIYSLFVESTDLKYVYFTFRVYSTLHFIFCKCVIPSPLQCSLIALNGLRERKLSMTKTFVPVRVQIEILKSESVFQMNNVRDLLQADWKERREMMRKSLEKKFNCKLIDWKVK